MRCEGDKLPGVEEVLEIPAIHPRVVPEYDELSRAEAPEVGAQNLVKVRTQATVEHVARLEGFGAALHVHRSSRTKKAHGLRLDVFEADKREVWQLLWIDRPTGGVEDVAQSGASPRGRQ